MSGKVTLIPARKRAGNNIVKKKEISKLKVVAYCRVSTDSEEQAGSYEAQVQHYTDYINRNNEWEFAGIYSDEGISGTNIKKREGFNDMISDCMAGKIDMIITKSISRFARNTIDCLKFVRQLKEKKIPIIFEKENINTMEASGELLLTIMASLAQQESASLSQNVKLGLQFRYQEGKVQVNHNHFLGYTKDDDGNLIIDEEEAKVVKRIFREYLDGASLRDIAIGLEKDGILTGGKKKKWHLSTIQGILQNEKYMGDALLQKTITTDFIEKIRIKNDGSAPQYYVKDSHEPIIPKDIFVQVQEEIFRRANLQSGKHTKKKRVYSSKYALSSICTCSKCGDIYRRLAWNNRGVKSTVWRCCTRVENGPSACDAPTIPENDLHEVTVKAINQVLKISPETLEKLMKNIETVILNETIIDLAEINQRINEKQAELLKLVRSKQDYDSLADEIDVLNDQKYQIMIEKANQEEMKRRILEMQEFLKSNPHEMVEYDEVLVRKYIKGIMIYDNGFVVEFKSGIAIKIYK
ncbi:recombinase family protein [Tuanshanicoccus lijuaniae]|uniref:recombinase family protein n=1 Tax=Aerococcaceae bacterium zg-1292 TaxID=2774330 RepID=UPI001934FB7F|nr:recombinase family protein [Aerococcaceae bacterium zg-1292]QQA38067.1 recombinase family protein [Aerococcaceae bacterium zg-1292]